jgi:lipopolysaccharide export system permease protein
VALKAALHKLESPVEPGTFNVAIKGFTVYVRDGNVEKGIWERVFIYQENKENGRVRLITAKEGRIDNRDDDSEIVLSGAEVTTFDGEKRGKTSSEYVENLRFVVQTKRGNIVKKLAATKKTTEEMGLSELADFARKSSGKTRKEAEILWQRRILLSITPLLFALLGTSLVSKFSRGGRGFGILLALISLIIYYLLALLGEQLVRTDVMGIGIAGIIPIGSVIAAIIWLSISQRFFIGQRLSILGSVRRPKRHDLKRTKVSPKSTYIDLTTGILDLDLILNLIKNFLLTVGFLGAIFMIFTAFELWKFVGVIDNGLVLLAGYLIFLIPFIYLEIAPSALMIGILATYVIKSRQNEIVTWTAAGQSAYRLLFPCFLLMIAVGLVNFGIQEWALTAANRKQDAMRLRIRSNGLVKSPNGKTWVNGESTIYAFEQSGGASDNDGQAVKNLLIFELDPNTLRLNSFTRVPAAHWSDGAIRFLETGHRFFRSEGDFIYTETNSVENTESVNPFEQSITKPSHLNMSETAYKVANSVSENDKRTYSISLQKKYTTPFLPFIIALFTAPFGISIHRKGNVFTLVFAVATWLVFMAANNAFEQFGSNGYISPFLAVWSPLIIFTILGCYLMTRIKT